MAFEHAKMAYFLSGYYAVLFMMVPEGRTFVVSTSQPITSSKETRNMLIMKIIAVSKIAVCFPVGIAAPEFVLTAVPQCKTVGPVFHPLVYRQDWAKTQLSVDSFYWDDYHPRNESRLICAIAAVSRVTTTLCTARWSSRWRLRQQ